MTEAAPPDDTHQQQEAGLELATSTGTHSIQPPNEIEDPMSTKDNVQTAVGPGATGGKLQKTQSLVSVKLLNSGQATICTQSAEGWVPIL